MWLAGGTLLRRRWCRAAPGLQSLLTKKQAKASVSPEPGNIGNLAWEELTLLALRCCGGAGTTRVTTEGFFLEVHFGRRPIKADSLACTLLFERSKGRQICRRRVGARRCRCFCTGVPSLQLRGETNILRDTKDPTPCFETKNRRTLGLLARENHTQIPMHICNRSKNSTYTDRRVAQLRLGGDQLSGHRRHDDLVGTVG